MKESKTSKTVYLTPAQLAKAKAIQKGYEKESKVTLSFSATIAKLIEEKK